MNAMWNPEHMPLTLENVQPDSCMLCDVKTDFYYCYCYSMAFPLMILRYLDIAFRIRQYLLVLLNLWCIILVCTA